MIYHLTSATRSAVASQNWYAALALALTIPDICGRIETPSASSQERFTRWWNQQHLVDKYTQIIGEQERIFLHAEDAYALRCAFLHEGRSDIETQRAQKALSNFRFIVIPAGGNIHCNQSDDVLQLQVDRFCEDVRQAAEAWEKALPSGHEYPAMLEIEVVDANTSISF